MDINTFKGSFTNFAKPTLFKVTGFGANRELEFMCKAAQLPGSTMGIIEVPYQGRKIKIPGDRIYTEWTMTIMNDSGFIVRNYFENWVDKMNDPAGNTGPEDVESIKEDGYIEQLGTDDAVLAKYKLVGTFPSEVSPIDVSWESNDTIEEYTISLQLDYWLREL